MKKLVIILFLLSINYSYGQEYFPFPVSEARWNQYIVHVGGSPYVEYKYRLGMIGDTLINSKLYSKVYRLDSESLDLLNAVYVGAIREENKKIYTIIEEQGETEILLYDFDVVVGDIITSNTSFGYFTEPLEVLSIETIVLLDGTSRKKYNIGPDFWIEGLGSTSGLFAPITDQPTNYTSPWLKCFNHNETDVFISDYMAELSCESCFCILDTPSLDSSQNIKVYPNPFDNELFYEKGNKEPCDIIIYNSKGLTIRKFNDHSFSSIYLGDLPKGIFLIQIISGEKYYAKKIIKE